MFLLTGVFVLGLTSIAFQILVVRQILTVFCGNEVYLGGIFAFWFIFGALGSLFAANLLAERKTRERFFWLYQILSGAILFSFSFNFFFIRKLLSLCIGEMGSFAYVALSCLFTFCLPVFFLGANFYLGVKLLKNINSVYAWEALGSGLGGIVFSFFLVDKISFLQAVFLLSGLNIIFGLAGYSHRSLGWKKYFFVLPLVLLILGLPFVKNIETALLQKNFPGYKLVSFEDSLYGRILVLYRSGQYSVFDNGVLTAVFPDVVSSEEAVYIPLLEHPKPKKVLLIGGFNPSILSELNKYARSVSLKNFAGLSSQNTLSVDFVELDPKMVKVVKEISRKSSYEFKYNIFTADGRAFVKNSSPETYDIVILNLPLPYNAQINRYYTTEFFRQVKNILRNGGVFSFTLPGGENYLSDYKVAFTNVLKSSLEKVFDDVDILPGEKLHFLAGKKHGEFISDEKGFNLELKRRGIHPLYINPGFLEDRLSNSRKVFLAKSLARNVPLPFKTNRDYKPAVYFLNFLFLESYFHSFWEKVFKNFTAFRIEFLLVLGIVLSGWLMRFLKGNFFSRLLVLFITGFVEISLQIVLCLGFQANYGYLYYQIGGIISSFMVGMGLAGILSSRKSFKNLFPFKILYGLYLGHIGSILLFLFLLGKLAVLEVCGKILFLICAFVSGIMAGLIFCSAAGGYRSRGPSLDKRGGWLYAVDLAGSGLGALFFSTLMIPLLGIYESIVFLFLLAGIIAL